ncbi:MAG: hypothetical protein ABGY10_10420 [bacterium]
MFGRMPKIAGYCPNIGVAIEAITGDTCVCQEELVLLAERKKETMRTWTHQTQHGTVFTGSQFEARTAEETFFGPAVNNHNENLMPASETPAHADMTTEFRKAVGILTEKEVVVRATRTNAVKVGRKTCGCDWDCDCAGPHHFSLQTVIVSDKWYLLVDVPFANNPPSDGDAFGPYLSRKDAEADFYAMYGGH